MHQVRTGEVETNIAHHNDRCRLQWRPELIACRTGGHSGRVDEFLQAGETQAGSTGLTWTLIMDSSA